MSFAADVKAELCRAKLGKKCCTQAEACGVLLYCNRFSLREVKIVTESPAFAQRLPGLFHRAFGLSFDEKGDPDAPGKRIFRITAPEKVSVRLGRPFRRRTGRRPGGTAPAAAGQRRGIP